MTIQEATYFLLNKLRTIYPEGEASQITDWVMEHLTGSKKTERMLYKNADIMAAEEKQLMGYTERLMKQEPVQYVLNESWFCGLRFYADNNVLIPRPETEELVEWIISDCKFPVSELKILDIGTGSGCIAIALKRRIRKAEVWGVDVSDKALAIARRNAEMMGTEINFQQLDFLDRNIWDQLPSFDIIVSNPPYIPLKDKETMHPNVLQYEPATALFVPDNDALVFYKALAEFGKKHLHKEGTIYAEIHEELGPAVRSLFEGMQYPCTIKKDMQQKDRMIRSGLV